jgi:hypothetical protein
MLVITLLDVDVSNGKSFKFKINYGEDSMVEFVETYNPANADYNDKLLSLYMQQRVAPFLTMWGQCPVVNSVSGRFDNVVEAQLLEEIAEAIASPIKAHEISSYRDVTFEAEKMVPGKVTGAKIRYNVSKKLTVEDPLQYIEKNLNKLFGALALDLDKKLTVTVASTAGISEADVQWPTDSTTWAQNPLRYLTRAALSFRRNELPFTPDIAILGPEKYIDYVDYMTGLENGFYANYATNFDPNAASGFPQLTVLGAYADITTAAGAAKDLILLDSKRPGFQIITNNDPEYSLIPPSGTQLNGQPIGGSIGTIYSGVKDTDRDLRFFNIQTAADIQVLDPLAYASIKIPDSS